MSVEAEQARRRAARHGAAARHRPGRGAGRAGRVRSWQVVASPAETLQVPRDADGPPRSTRSSTRSPGTRRSASSSGCRAARRPRGGPAQAGPLVRRAAARADRAAGGAAGRAVHHRRGRTGADRRRRVARERREGIGRPRRGQRDAAVGARVAARRRGTPPTGRRPRDREREVTWHSVARLEVVPGFLALCRRGASPAGCTSSTPSSARPVGGRSRAPGRGRGRAGRVRPRRRRPARRARGRTGATRFRLAADEADLASRLQPGTYDLETGMDFDAAIEALRRRPRCAVGARFTVQEGLTVEQTSRGSTSSSMTYERRRLPGGARRAPRPAATGTGSSSCRTGSPNRPRPDAVMEPFEGLLSPQTYDVARTRRPRGPATDGRSADHDGHGRTRRNWQPLEERGLDPVRGARPGRA